MSTARGTQQPQWQAARVPKLSYRKPLPQDELDKINSVPPREYVPQASPITRTVSVRETVDRPPAPSSVLVAPRKKGSILSGFFSKEPTMSALAQVEADLTAKHGAATPQSVPHVSSRKMPEHVPKVNSKWDGVPEMVKLREREEKERKRLSQQSSLASPQQYNNYRDSDESIDDVEHNKKTRSRRGSDAVSHTDSWQSRGERYPGPQRQESYSTATSSNASIEDKRRPTASVKSQSLRSPSGNSLPEITSFFPHHQPSRSAQVPHTSHSGHSARLQSPKSIDSRPDTVSSRDTHGSHTRAIPEHSSSPATTPREMSPVTPVYCTDKETAPRMANTKSSSTTNHNSKRSIARPKHAQLDAFLAGEARPVELDDEDDEDEDEEEDSDATDRTRLPLRQKPTIAQQRVQAKASTAVRPQPSRQASGVKTSKIARGEAAPWELQEPAFSKTAAPIIAKNRVPKSLAGLK